MQMVLMPKTGASILLNNYYLYNVRDAWVTNMPRIGPGHTNYKINYLLNKQSSLEAFQYLEIAS